LKSADIRAAARLHTSDRLVTTPQEKRAIFIATGAAAVDMETDIVRRSAAKVGVAFVSIRAIVDTVDDVLDPELLTLVDERGATRVGKASWFVCGHPSRIADVVRVGIRSSRACRNLARATAAVIEHWQRSPTAGSVFPA